MRRFALALAAGVLLAAIPAIVHVVVGDHAVHFTGTTHFYSVGFSALVASAAAVGLTVVGARRGDTRTMLVGTSFAVMATLLALHGFSTPGVWFQNNGVVAITGGATLPVGALISKRLYRAAWSERDALDLLRRETGTKFDERCVNALERVVDRNTAPAARVAQLRVAPA